MSKAAKAPAEAAEEPRRRPGRPQSGDTSSTSRAKILRTALKLAKSVPLQDLSIVTVAKTMKVTPPLIHYYIGGRDWLTSGVMNLFYRELIRKWPAETGDWEEDLHTAARTLYEQLSLYGGIAAYCVSNSRFRVFQLTAFGDRDYGVEVLDRFTGCVRASGLSGERTGIFAHLFMEFIISTGYGASHHIFPSEHQTFLREKMAKLEEDRYQHIHYAQQAPLKIDGELAFEEGCKLMMRGIAVEAQNEKSGTSTRRTRAAEAGPVS